MPALINEPQVWDVPWISDAAATVVDWRIRPGMNVRVRTADDRWVPKVARSPILHGYKWRIVIVATPGTSDVGLGWPADDVVGT